MDFNTLLSLTLLIGAIAGWFAGQLVQGTGCGLLGDIFVGIVGALVAVLGLNLGGGTVAGLVAATLGQLSCS